MVNPIPYFARNIWSKWDVQIVILTSFCLQIILTLLGYLRRKGFTRNISLMFLWLIYLGADSTATYCIGLISSNLGDRDTQISNANDLLLAFWAPFLLLHLGGPDTITAFSHEDTQLWLRHLLGLIFQVCQTGYVFLLTMPNSPLWLSTSLVFVAGIMKFGERIRSLQLARPLPRRKWIPLFRFSRKESDDVMATNYVVGMHEKEKLSDVVVVMRAHGYIFLLNSVVTEEPFGLSPHGAPAAYFQTLTAIDALRIIEVELELLYETYYAKGSVIYSSCCVNISPGCCFRFLCLALVVAALLLFVFDKKHGCDEFDVKVTYALLCGAVAMDVLSFFMLNIYYHFFGLFYNHTNFIDGYKKPFDGFLKLMRRGMWKEWRFEEKSYKIICRTIFGYKWSYPIYGFNLISYCLHNKKEMWVDKVMNKIKGKDFVEKMKYVKKQPLLQNLWIFIFLELKRKSLKADHESLSQMCSSRGEWVIRNGELSSDDVNTLMPYVERNRVTFDQCIITWHIATDLLFYGEGGDDGGGAQDLENGRDKGIVPTYEEIDFRDFSKILSDYLLYLLVVQPTMMPADIRSDNQMFETTCAEISECFAEEKMMEQRDEEEKETRKSINKERKACKEEHEMRKAIVNTQLLFGVKLAKDINKLEGGNKWKMIAQVWVELLSFTAFNSKPLNHVQQLGTGTEFLSHVWILMNHFSLTKRFA